LVAAPQSPHEPNGRPVLVCDIGGLDRADLEAIDAIARLALAAQRLGCALRLENASPDLRDLVALVGLAEVVSCWTASGIESGGQAEQREVPGGVEEERDPADPPA
jgi:ABC-type transporter Mla MlaB component